VLGDLIGVAIAGGLFCVPLYALLQHESEPRYRARVIAANNIVNALAMTLAASSGQRSRARHDDDCDLRRCAGLATIPVAIGCRMDSPPRTGQKRDAPGASPRVPGPG
jgi:hypothetical protein